MKFQKFHLSTVISYIFFIVFMTLLLGSTLWFYNSSIKTMEYETKNYFKQNRVTHTFSDCQWPIGDPQEKDFHFCEANTVEFRVLSAWRATSNEVASISVIATETKSISSACR